jgi:hypothetical protein
MIGIKRGGKVKGVYCHYDGHPSSVGKILFKHYTTEQLVDELIKGGDMSFLGNTPDTTAYYSLRGEDAPFIEYNSVEDFANEAYSRMAEYIYIFEFGLWFVSEQEEFVPLEKNTFE